MRGSDVQQLGMFSYVLVEDQIPRDHPIRKLRVLVDAILKDMDVLLDSLNARMGRDSIPPSICCAPRCCRVYGARSERLLMELLFLWFVA